MSVAGRGRPLRFLLVLAVAWISVRVAMLWPAPKAAADEMLMTRAPPLAVSSGLREVAHKRPTQPLPRRLAEPQRQLASLGSPRPAHRAAPMPPRRSRELRQATVTVSPAPPRSPGSATPQQLAAPFWPTQDDAASVARSAMVVPAVPARAAAGSRWSGSAWVAARGGAELTPGALGGQLGGSQAGARLVYALDVRKRVALVGRVTTPLGDGLREASLGIEWQPTRLPVRLVVEQRVAVSGGQGGPGFGVIGGFGPIDIGHRLRAESYAQMGVIRRGATEPYVHGAMRVTHPVGSIGPLRFDLGAGVWGGAQRGATRLDLGPTLGVALPMPKQSLRVALDWRERIAGGAHPGSGPALTLGSDF